MSDEIDQEFEAVRRQRLRAALSALALLDTGLVPGFMRESIAVKTAVEALKDNFQEDFRATCEGCSAIILYGDQGHDTEDGCTLCAECSPSWGDIKRQWEDEGREEDEDGDRARFLEAYEAHIAGGGSPDDVVLYTIT